ncbi:MAG: DUF2723 domain-containing protein [Chlorobi bacterium]|nr:DUF2723 domain-containing protein [Chlorobiota bacterium]
MITFITYYLTSWPSVSPEDSGTRAAADYLQEIPDAPGAPLWIIVANTFAKIMPDDPARLLTLFSALCGRFGVMMVYLITTSLSSSAQPPYQGNSSSDARSGLEGDG